MHVQQFGILSHLVISTCAVGICVIECFAIIVQTPKLNSNALKTALHSFDIVLLEVFLSA